jgi:hypothetical protein
MVTHNYPKRKCSECQKTCYGHQCRECFEKKGANLSIRACRNRRNKNIQTIPGQIYTRLVDMSGRVLNPPTIKNNPNISTNTIREETCQ